MIDIHNYVRPNILTLTPYSSARDEHQGTEGIFLDANENPRGTLNRYPDPYQRTLRARIASLKNIPVESLFIGNGSDEVIDLLIRIFCRPGQDAIIICPPTYKMYEVMAAINEAEVIRIPLKSDFQPDTDALLSARAKILFLCSPNNPTGNVLHGLEEIIDRFDGIVVVDEAYIDYSREASVSRWLDRYPHLVVLQTFSKAWALAGARVGMAMASPSIIRLMQKVKPPYNVSQMNQQAALTALESQTDIRQQAGRCIQQREMLRISLASLPCVRHIYPSDANFLLVEVHDAPAVYKSLIRLGVIVRNCHASIPNCIRITIGTDAENAILLHALQRLSYEESTVY